MIDEKKCDKLRRSGLTLIITFNFKTMLSNIPTGYEDGGLIKTDKYCNSCGLIVEGFEGEDGEVFCEECDTPLKENGLFNDLGL